MLEIYKNVLFTLNVTVNNKKYLGLCRKQIRKKSRKQAGIVWVKNALMVYTVLRLKLIIIK